MKIEYQNAPLPGEHNNGEIWVKWRLEVGDSSVIGWAPTQASAEFAVQKQAESYERLYGKFDWLTYHRLHSAVAHDKRSVQT